MIQHAASRSIPGPSGHLAVHLQGSPSAPAVVMCHSILSDSRMWQAQSELLVGFGLQTVRIDARGHGGSRTQTDRCTMDDLGEDVLAVMDALAIRQAHFVGLSLGGMAGFGLGIRHPDRFLSLCLCDARADAPPAVAAPWDERIALALAEGSCATLGPPTVERWFGKPFVDANPAVVQPLLEAAAAVQVEGFVACARAIQQLAYLDDASRIRLPVSLIVGRNDGVLPAAMADLQQRIPGSTLELIDGAGHLPNIDQPDAFNAALARHFRVHAPQP